MKLFETWDSIKDYLEDNQTYLDFGCKIIYCDAHSIKYLQENNHSNVYFSYNTMTYIIDNDPLISAACVPDI